ncbi:DNA-binding SARP family transcriptional activator [Amycolatopsis sulphurea]|uniref:DNA-binding SARP family transcriptional activator n=2 Tax=Amycolatopsis sulphurea TaxID=76022 RepID=A0A2A9FH30_9PSEU|nr:DNA-binding SARP family transcriptional activator [Amycolatopsis sulphurea]
MSGPRLGEYQYRMKFNLLGPMEVLCADGTVTPSAAKMRWILALLLLHGNRVVDQASMIDELWGDHPPRSAVTTTQTYVYQLRKKYDYYAQREGRKSFIVTRAPGYLLQLDDDQLDVRRFQRLSAEGSALFSAGHAERADEVLRQALRLWRGPALAGIAPGRMLQAHVAYLEEARLRTVQVRILADAALGRHRDLIPELRSLVIEHPLDEWFHQQLITALAEAGRRGDALHACRVLHRTLADELGVAPSEPLRKLQQDLLTGHVRRAPAHV